MTTTLGPHDLIWLTARDALEGIAESWVKAAWHTGLPVVVRRDVDSEGRIPVGVRGLRRDQRAAGWVKPEHVTRVVSPESLSVTADLLRSPFVTQPPVQVALQLSQQPWPWSWGITGSTGYALATGIPVIHADSDLDMLVEWNGPVSLLDYAGLRADLEDLTGQRVELTNRRLLKPALAAAIIGEAIAV